MGEMIFLQVIDPVPVKSVLLIYGKTLRLKGDRKINDRKKCRQIGLYCRTLNLLCYIDSLRVIACSSPVGGTIVRTILDSPGGIGDQVYART